MALVQSGAAFLACLGLPPGQGGHRRGHHDAVPGSGFRFRSSGRRCYLIWKMEEAMPKARRPFILAIFAVVTAVLGCGPPASAQSWPQRPVKFLVTLGPGSGVDIGTRLLGDRLSARWGQPVVVENRPGGDGIVAITRFLGAPDGHVLLAPPTSYSTAHPYLHENLPYKQSVLLPIARVSNTIITISVPVSLKLASFADVVAIARAQA